MSFEIAGRLTEVYPVTVVSDKFKKREFVIEITETRNSFDFTDYVKFQVIQDKCSLIDLFKKGDMIKVSFNLRGRKWEKDGTVNFFTNLEAWKIEKVKPAATTMEDGDLPSAPFPEVPDTPANSEENGDLPF